MIGRGFDELKTNEPLLYCIMSFQSFGK